MKMQVKEEMGDGAYGAPPPNMFVKQEHLEGYYPDQQQQAMYNQQIQLPPPQNNNNNGNSNSNNNQYG